MNQQFMNNLGKSVVLSKATRVSNQYGPLGAIGDFAEIFDSPHDPNDSQLRIYNINTWLGNYTLPSPGLGPRKLAVLGKLEWGIGNASFEANFDWKMGTQISLAASFVRISAAYSEFGETTPDNVKIGAMLSSGSRAARSQVTRSYPQIILEDSDIALFPIPPFAHALNIFSAEPDFYNVGECTVRYVGGVSAGFSSATSDLVSFESDGVPFLAGLANEDGVRFPETARFVQVQAGTGSYPITPCFTLSF